MANAPHEVEHEENCVHRGEDDGTGELALVDAAKASVVYGCGLTRHGNLSVLEKSVNRVWGLSRLRAVV